MVSQHRPESHEVICYLAVGTGRGKTAGRLIIYIHVRNLTDFFRLSVWIPCMGQCCWINLLILISQKLFLSKEVPRIIRVNVSSKREIQFALVPTIAQISICFIAMEKKKNSSILIL